MHSTIEIKFDIDSIDDVYCLTEIKALLVLQYQFVSCIQVPLVSNIAFRLYFASPLRVRAKRGQGTAGFQNFNSLLARLKI